MTSDLILDATDALGRAVLFWKIFQEKGISMRAAGSEGLTEIIAPYYNRQFDGKHYYSYLPPDRKDGCAVLTVAGQVAHFSHPVGFGYCKHAQMPVR